MKEPPTTSRPLKVFYSYASKDKELRDNLGRHLKSLKRQGLIEDWHDRCIGPGQEWAQQIDAHLESADIILLLISSDFIESDYCYDREMTRAMERHEVGEARVIPVRLRPVDCEGTPFSKLQYLPSGDLPVTSWQDKDAALLDIARRIRKVVQELQQPASTPAAPSRPKHRASSPAELRANYLALMTEEWRALRLAALDPIDANPYSRRPMTLEQIYVSLDTTTSRPERLRRKKESWEQEPPLSAVEALQEASEGRMVLLGQPGSGKSTLARHLALMLALALHGACKLRERLPGWKGKALLPVFISLGRLEQSISQTATAGTARMVEDFIQSQVDEKVEPAGYGVPLLQELKEAGGLVIFDGLDEVPGQRRQLLKEAITHCAALLKRCKVLVTCRTHSYLQDAGWSLDWPTVHELAPFDPKKINAFIDAWYAALGELEGGTDYRRKAERLKAALSPEDQRGLAELAGTPLLLTEMAIVHTHKNELPESRVEVYQECVDILLRRWHSERLRMTGAEARSLQEELKALDISSSKLDRALQAMAYKAHDAAKRQRLGSQSRALVSKGTIYEAMLGYLGDDGLKVFLNYCQHANGLLLAEGVVQPADAPPDAPPEPVYAFPHLSFEEYLAACYLRELPKGLGEAAQKAADPTWREVVRFLGESLCFGKRANLGMAQLLLQSLCPTRRPANDGDWRKGWLAGELLAAVRREATTEELQEGLDQRIVGRLVQLLETASALATAPQDRAAVGRTLAVLGDTRPGIGLKDDLPELLWVPIPGTDSLRLGNGLKPDPEFREEDETWPADAPPLRLKPFFLATYLVTVAQFRPFVESGAYRQDCYWTQAGIKDRGDQDAPRYWNDPHWHLDNHPVIGVTWYEAVAYCRWLTERLQAVGRLSADYEIRLPTEAEWEWAARGPEGRRWPWGDTWQAGYCNSEGTGIARTSAVGCFPAGAGGEWWDQSDRLPVLEPCGEVLYDLAGNVWEWCSTRWQNRYPLPVLATEWAADYLEGDEWRVLRGGYWYNKQDSCRGASRGRYPPAGCGGGRGFRCCASMSSL